MHLKIPPLALLLLFATRPVHAQTPRPVRVVAVIESIYADSAGLAIRRGRALDPAALDSLVAGLKRTVGGTIWFSWSGGPKSARTGAQDRLLAHLRASGVHVELRTDSTFYSRVIRP